MGRLDPQFSAAQRQAVVRAVIEDGLSARETVEAAAAGELGLPAFEVSETTCRRLAREAREGPEGTRTPSAEPDDDDPALAFAKAQRARILKMANPATRDLKTLEQAQRMIDRAEKKRAARRIRRVKSPESFDPEKLSPLMRQLLDEVAEHDAAKAEGRPCRCGSVTCAAAQVANGEAEAAQKRKQAWRREWEQEQARRRGNTANHPTPPTPTPTRDSTQPLQREPWSPKRNNNKRGDDIDPRDWALLT